MALANKRRRHAPEQRRGVFRRNHHGSGLRTGRTPKPGNRRRHRKRPRSWKHRHHQQPGRPPQQAPQPQQAPPPVRSRAKGIARDICQQGRPCILPRRECEPRTPSGARTGPWLPEAARTSMSTHGQAEKKRFLTRGKRSSIFQQHAQRALRQKLREQSQSLPRLDHPQLRQPIKVSPDHPQHRHFRKTPPSSAPAPAGTPCCASCTAASKAGRPTPGCCASRRGL